MNGTVGDIVTQTIKSIPVEITDGEADLFNSLPTDEVVSALKGLVNSELDRSIISRAFDALLKVDGLDKVQFLINLADENPQRWRIVCCRNLSRFRDERAIAKLCDTVKNNDDPDVRYAAAESLGIIGDETAIAALEYVEIHDNGKDWEGFRVADMASEAIKRIRGRMSTEIKE